MRTRSLMSLISGRFHWLASNRPTLPRRGEVTGEPALGDGGPVGVIAHSGFPSLTGALSCLTRYPTCDSQIKVLVYTGLGTSSGGVVAASNGVVELAVAGAVQEALPLVPVEHEHPLIGVPRHPHQNPLRAFPGLVPGAREGDLEGAFAAAGAMPDLRGQVDA